MALEDALDVVREAHPIELTFAAFHPGARLADLHYGARLRRMPRAHQGERLALAEDALDEKLDLPAARLAAEEPRPDDARVVQYEDIALVDELRQVGESQVVQRAARIDVQQAATGALRGGMLGDELGRQRVVELGNQHGPRIIISSLHPAGMAEPVDAADSKSAGGITMRFRVSLPAPREKNSENAAFLLDTRGHGG